LGLATRSYRKKLSRIDAQCIGQFCNGSEPRPSRSTFDTGHHIDTQVCGSRESILSQAAPFPVRCH